MTNFSVAAGRVGMRHTRLGGTGWNTDGIALMALDGLVSYRYIVLKMRSCAPALCRGNVGICH